MYLVENPPLYCCQDESFQKYGLLLYFQSGWANNNAVWKVKSKNFFIVNAKVSTNYLKLATERYSINIIIVFVPWTPPKMFFLSISSKHKLKDVKACPHHCILSLFVANKQMWLMVKNAIIKSIYLCLLELNTDDMFAAKTYVYGHSLPSPGTKKIKNTFWTK